MENRRLSPECVACLARKYVDKAPSDAPDELKLEYMRGALRLISDADERDSAPLIVDRMNSLWERLFGEIEDISPLKSHFNRLVLSLEDKLVRELDSTPDRIGAAIRYAAVGNYIDFGAIDSVDEKKLLGFIGSASDQALDEDELAHLKSDLSSAKKLVYLTDNCGEIVFDKLLISEICSHFPSLEVTAVVRGEPILNDATLSDAREVGLDRLVRVIGNGSRVAGTEPSSISEEARSVIDSADLIISKGQGNFETLSGCGKNIYYIFMCKCRMFADRFGVPLYSGMLVNDGRMKLC